ncbi:putative glycosyl transferase (plasmid) [Sulfitobacter sp. THAF37]|uniref:glycosyltransferase n=1 Tax=Sulfitobacter sp. THAF37 TaxID=2587855 RepID=UPI0012687AD5|nr:glycosyltransferase [Sulfitobacter sp. THAF37]QFT60812.1 putative glycosyl transferase [Sulfitobacter sp. THAF37]
MTQIATPLAACAVPRDIARAAASDQPLRVVLWGSYDLGKPRTRILREGLVEAGAEVTEIHADIWKADADKSQLSRAQMALRLLSLLLAYPVLIVRYLRAPQHDLVIVPYLGQFDVIVLWPFARLRGRPVVLDLFLSLYDTVVNDRKMVPSGGFVARCLRTLERLSCRAVDTVLLDTEVHAARIAQVLGLDPEKFDAVPVGVEPGAFAHVAPHVPHEGRTRVLFYGQLIPLHGVETILAAALSERGRQYDWHIIGSGQDRPRVAHALAAEKSDHVRWDDWVPYAELAQAIETTDICLGIFGTSDKAAGVVPNKVYQSLFAGRAVITRDGPAMREVFAQADPALQLVPAADPFAILDAIDRLRSAGFPAMHRDRLEVAQPARIGEILCAKIAPLVGRT